MPEISTLAAFALVALGMVLSPGPNMVYIISRSVSQGPKAGLISLIGVAAGFLIYMLMAVLGITVLLMAIPFAYDSLRFAGALYLLYLAWQAIKPGARSPLEVQDLPQDSNRKLILMGLFTNLLNPKAAVLYLSLLPQFIEPKAGSVFAQSIILGLTQISVSVAVNACIAIFAGSIAAWLATRPTWLTVQRWFMAGVLGSLAVKMAVDGRR